MPPVGFRRLKRRFLLSLFKTTADLRAHSEYCGKWPLPSRFNTAHMAVSRQSMTFKRTSKNLKKYAYQSLPISCQHTIPIKNILANTSAWRLRTSPFYQ
jgi:hypothetical protein